MKFERLRDIGRSPLRTLLKRFPPLPNPNNSMQGSLSYFSICRLFCLFFLGAGVRMSFVYVVDVIMSCDPSKKNKQKKYEANTSECDCF